MYDIIILGRCIMKKKIIIKSKKDLNKFYTRLWLYRSFIYRNVVFELEKDKYNISSFIDALNIKNRRKRLEYIYDLACLEIDSFYEGKNVCGFKDDQCYVQRKLNNGRFNGCCRLCFHQNNKGCLTKNLACKLFFCSEAKKRHKVLTIKDIKIFKILTIRQRYIMSTDYFNLREEVINDLYIGSIMLVLFKYVYRIIKKSMIRIIKRRK